MNTASLIYRCMNAAAAGLCLYLAATTPPMWALAYAVFAAGNIYHAVRLERVAQ